MASGGKKSSEKRRRNMLLFVGFVTLIMILSGFYYTGSQDRAKPSGGQEAEKSLFNQYNVQEVDNSSILIKIKDKTDDLIVTFVPGKSITGEMIKSLLNMSSTDVLGLNYVSCDATNSYLLCTINIKTEDYSFLNEKLTDILGDYYLKRAFIGKLEQPYSTILGANESYIIGNLNDVEGTYVKAWLYQKDYGGFVGFEEKKLPLVDEIPATVLNVSSYIFSGIIEDDFSLENFSEELDLNLSETEFSSPRFLINDNIENKTLAELNSLNGVSATIEENVTIISFNKSIATIKNILLREGITYILENGTLYFPTSLDANVSKIKDVMGGYGIRMVKIEKGGIVSFTDEVIYNGIIAKIENSNQFDAVLNEKTKPADKITIILSVVQFGRQIIPIGAKEKIAI